MGVGGMIKMIESQDRKERGVQVVMLNKNILQRSIVHLHPLECNEEEQSDEIPIKTNLNQKVYCKEEELKSDEDKVRPRLKTTAAAEARNKF